MVSDHEQAMSHISRSTPVRDEYENKKAGFDKELSDLLGVSWTFDFNPLAIYPYAESQHFAKEQPGTVLGL
jgi:hypothetical protein